MLQKEALDGKAYLVGVYFDHGRYKQAKELAEEILAEDPDDEKIRYIVGLCETELGNHRAARKIFKELMTSSLADEAIRELGRLCLMAEDYSRAKKYFRSYIKRNPNCGEGYSALALAQCFQGNPKYKKNIVRALARAPRNTDVLYRAFLISHRCEKDIFPEVRYLQSMHDLGVDEDRIAYCRSLVEYKLEDFKAALSYAKQAYSFCPGDESYKKNVVFIGEKEKAARAEGRRFWILHAGLGVIILVISAVCFFLQA